MPAKLQKPERAPRKNAEAPARVIATPRPKAPASQREYAALRLFLSQDAGFRLALATYDRPATRDGLMARLVEDLVKSQTLLSVLNVTEGEGSLLLRLEKHLAAVPTPKDWKRAVAVVNMEDRLTYSDVPVRAGDVGGRDLTFLEEANLHRDAFPKVCACPLLIWLTELAESALAKNAPDLWHWRNARFDFQREGSFLDDFHAHPAERVAWFEHIARASNRLRDKRGEIGDLIELGNAKADMGDARGAMKHFELALKKAREIGDRRGEGRAVCNLGNAYADLSDARKAIEFYEQALVVDREIGDRRGEGIVLGNLANAYADLGDARKAIWFHEQALVIMREVANKRAEGMILVDLGVAHSKLGDVRKALEFYEQALIVVREIGDRQSESKALNNLGNANSNLGETHKAIEFYEQALVIAREIGDRRGEGTDLWNSALALDKLGERAQAIARGETALKIYEAIEDPRAAQVHTQLAEWRAEGQNPTNPSK